MDKPTHTRMVVDMIEIITGDLLDATEKYIAHQTNCVSIGGASGIARAIFDKYPHADCYMSHTKTDIPGTIEVRGNGVDKRFVINMFAQFYPGGLRYPDSDLDGIKAREKYFHQCLLRVAKITDLESIAFPYKVGCGIAGGNWEHFLGTLTNFAKYVKEQQGTRVVIYQRNEDK